MNVFIGGSRAVSKLNPVICARLDDLIRRGCTILVGDANGADKAVQRYFAKRRYPHVIVFCMEECRNNVGSWPTRHIKAPTEHKNFSYYVAKDVAMSDESQCGLMLWDAKSKGTLRNIMELVEAQKRTLVYFAPTKDFHVLANPRDLTELLACCKKDAVDAAVRALGLKDRFLQSDLPLSLH